jgi:hypothetical protein
MECVIVVNPSGPNHCPTCFASVHAAKTSSRGASIRRVVTISRSAVLEGLVIVCMAPLLVVEFV